MKRGILLGAIVVVVLAVAIMLFSSTDSVTTGYPTYEDSESGTGVKCHDTDGEKRFKLQLYEDGYVVRTNVDGAETRFDDKCIASTKIKEYVCKEGGRVDSNTQNCPNGCDDNACKR